MRNIFLILLFFNGILFAQIPNNYYNAAYNKSGFELKTTLHSIIKSGHTPVSYNSLWEHFKVTDKRPNGKVWDMYSNCTFTFGSNQCGNYSNICDCYNREHSFPKDWFNDAAPMYSDLFQLYPTDGKVNGYRSNYPFGETNGTMYGTGKLGSSTFSGYNGTVFEPDDEYKGDFARTYFYMATRYQDVITSWNAVILAGNNTTVYVSWTINLLLKWHRQDPVSSKEIDRNNAVNNIQKNRNPFIDYPELVELIWGTDFGKPFLPESYPNIYGENFACENSSNNIYKTDKGKTNYVWTVSGGVIEGASNNDSVAVKWGNTTTGQITVHYTDNGAQSTTAERSIEVRQRPLPHISGEKYILINSTNNTYTTDAEMTNYQWSLSANLVLSEGGGNQDNFVAIDAGEEGSEFISVNYLQNGCPALEPVIFPISVVNKIGIKEETSQTKLMFLSPQSDKNILIVMFEEPVSGILRLYNMLGVLVQQIKIQSTESQVINIAALQDGMYILELTTENYIRCHIKTVKY